MSGSRPARPAPASRRLVHNRLGLVSVSMADQLPHPAAARGAARAGGDWLPTAPAPRSWSHATGRDRDHPSGATPYVANSGDETVTPVNLATGQPGSPIGAGTDSSWIAITWSTQP